MSRLILASVSSLALLSVAAPLGAATNDPIEIEAGSGEAATAATPAQLVAGIDIPHSVFQLENGLTVIVHTDRSAPVVDVEVWYNVGSKDEPEGRSGFAHLFEHLLFGGSENAPGDFMGSMKQLGPIGMNGSTSFDRTNYFQTVPTATLERALFLESDRMGYVLGAISQERLDLQRGVVQNEKRQGDNRPFGMVSYAQLKALFPDGHPYQHSVIGSMADLDAASMETVRSWFRDKYGPNNAILTLAGDIDEPTARRLAQKYFGAIPRGLRNEPVQAAVTPLEKPVSLVMHDRVANPRIYRTWVGPGIAEEEATVLYVAAKILGGLASSRFDKELVREDRLAVKASAANYIYHRVGMFEVMADVAPGKDIVEVDAEMNRLIETFLEEGPTKEEVERAATSIAAANISGFENVSGRAATLTESLLYTGNSEHYKRELEIIASVTPERVREVAAKWLGRPSLSLTVMPGEREAYEESAKTERAIAEPAAELVRVPRDPSPEIGEVADLDFPDIQRTTLSNGVKLTYAQVKATPITRLTLAFDAGLTADPDDQRGVQTLMLDLLKQGADKRDAMQFAETLESLGGTLSTAASIDRSAVSIRTLSPNLAPMLKLLEDVLERPQFPVSEFDRLKGERLATIAQDKTDPESLAMSTMPELLYGPGHPYGMSFLGSGSEETVKTLTRDDVLHQFRTWIRPDNAEIFVVSNLPLETVREQVEKSIGDWAASTTAKGVKDFDVEIAPAKTRIVLIDRPQSPQSYILAGQILDASGKDDLIAFNAANKVVGGDFMSRINSDLRETKGWSYGTGGGLYTFEHLSPYMVSAPVQADRTADSVAALIEQYEAFLSDRGVTQEERNRVVNMNTRQLAGLYAMPGSILGALQSNAQLDRPDNYQETLASRTHALTPQSMDEAARQFLDPAEFRWVIVGDAATVEPQLKARGFEYEVRRAPE